MDAYVYAANDLHCLCAGLWPLTPVETFSLGFGSAGIFLVLIFAAYEWRTRRGR